MHSVIGNISKDFTINSIKKIGLKKVANFFSVHFNPIDTNDILDIQFCLIKRTSNKKMFELIKEILCCIINWSISWI